VTWKPTWQMKAVTSSAASAPAEDSASSLVAAVLLSAFAPDRGG
jgi:hypothetical protein